ncbi:hypothetical protein ACROYT_G044479 [Oculina patagonica]
MVGITVAIILLSSLISIDAGMSYDTESNSTQLAKHSAMGLDCNTATYKTVTLYNFVYTYKCFPPGWEGFFSQENIQQEINHISYQLNKFKNNKNYLIEPPMPHMFNAFQNIGLENVKVVILGQDPTPQANQATGMAFSLKPGVDPRTVPSVLNMLVELRSEGIDVGLSNGDLTSWRNQGVLLLNAALTVQQGQAGSHQGVWQGFTELLIQYISKNGPPSAWILWGAEAQRFAKFISKNKPVYIKTGGHPSPQGAAHFFGGNYFRCANEFLEGFVHGGIDWHIPPPPHEIESIRTHAQC